MDDVLHGFGAAAYNAQVMERKLVLLLSALLAARDPPTADRAYDRAMADQEAKTLGQLLKALRQAMSLPEGLETRLNDAQQSRNHLIHDFFWVHAEDELSSAGRSTMFDKLGEISARFYELAGEIDAVTKAFMRVFVGGVVGERGLPDSLADAIDRLRQNTECAELDLMHQWAKRRDGREGL